MNKKMKIFLGLILAIIIVVSVYFSIIGIILLTSKPIVPNNQIPTPTPTLIPIINVQVSGTVYYKNLGQAYQFTQLEFVDASNNTLKYYTDIQNGTYSYSISLPNNKTYEVDGNWATPYEHVGIYFSGIDLGTLYLYSNQSAITENYIR